MILKTAKMLSISAIAALPVITFAQAAAQSPSSPSMPSAPKEAIKPDVPSMPNKEVIKPEMPAVNKDAIKPETPQPAMPMAPKDAPAPASSMPPLAPTPESTTNAPAADANTNMPIVAMPTPITQNEGTTPSGQPIVVVPTPAIPSADTTLLDKAVKAMNTNSVDDFVAVLDNANFVFITPKADKVTNVTELKVQWGTLFGAAGSLKDFKASFTPSKVIELAAGAASFDGSIVFTSTEGKTIRAVLSGSMRYVNDDWKIASINLSAPDITKMAVEKEFAERQGFVSSPLAALIGIVLGAVGMMAVARKKAAQLKVE